MVFGLPTFTGFLYHWFLSLHVYHLCSRKLILYSNSKCFELILSNFSLGKKENYSFSKTVWLPCALDLVRCVLASPPYTLVLDLHISNFAMTPRYTVLYHCPQAPPNPPQYRVYSPSKLCAPRYSFSYCFPPCKKNKFLPIFTWSFTPEFPASETYWVFGGKGSRSLLVCFWRAHSCIREIVTLTVAWWYFSCQLSLEHVVFG